MLYRKSSCTDFVEVKCVVHDVRFEVFTAMKIEFEVFCVLMSCSVVVRYQCFTGSCCLHLQGEVAGIGRNGIDLDPDLTEAADATSWQEVRRV